MTWDSWDPTHPGPEFDFFAPHSPIGLHPSGAGGLFNSTPCGCGSTGRSHRGRQGSRLDVDLEPILQTRPTGLRRNSRTPLSSSCVPDRRTRLPQYAACFWRTRQSFTVRGCWTSLRCQPPWHRGPEGSRRAPRLHREFIEQAMASGLVQHADRPCRLASDPSVAAPLETRVAAFGTADRPPHRASHSERTGAHVVRSSPNKAVSPPGIATVIVNSLSRCSTAMYTACLALPPPARRPQGFIDPCLPTIGDTVPTGRNGHMRSSTNEGAVGQFEQR